MDKVTKAVELFNSGFNCSQAVFSAFGGELIANETALKIALGFGAGMGRLQQVCGAVTGAIMALSLKYGSAENDTATKEKLYGLVREFTLKFEERNKTIVCKDLLAVDLITGDKTLNSIRVKSICPKLVHDAAEILEKMGV